jgi:hypothetical protein
MNVKELDSAVSSAGSLLKNLEPMLNRAEKWHRGQRLAAAVVSLAVAVLLLSGTLPTPALTAFVLGIFAISLLTIKRRVLEAEVFAVKDKEGRYRAALASDHNNISLIFFDEKANPRGSVGLTNKGEPNLTFFDANLRPRATFAIPAESGYPTLHLLGTDSESYFQCGVSNENKSSISLGRSTGAHIFVTAGDDAQTIAIYDSEEKVRASLYATEKTSAVRLKGKSENEASAELGVYDETIPILLCNGKSGKPVVLLGTDKDGSGKLNVFDNDGGLVQHVP